MSAVIFLTGATGFLGTYIAHALITTTSCQLIVLVRATDPGDAKRRLTRLWWDWPELVQALETHVEIICGEITRPHLGLESRQYQDLCSRVTHIIHAAADVRFSASLAELRQTNVQGTQNLLHFARAVHQQQELQRLVYISTAYVAGGREGLVQEEDLTDQFGFSSGYELSKFEAEQLVQAAKTELPVCVLRPGMIVGDQTTGAIKTFNTLYFPLRLYLNGKIRWIPMPENRRVNLIPVDYVAACAVKATFQPDAVGLNFHLTAATELLPTLGELLPLVRKWAAENLKIKLPRPCFWSLPLPRHWSQFNPNRSPRKSSDWQAWLSLLPYFQHEPAFDRRQSDRVFGPYALNWRELLPRLLEYAVAKNFLHQTERTVHEQILFRLQSRRRPVTFHDFSE
ncbi:SDR family oxidoreductase, partial [candidate division KSB1 bacterium]|nr:SDR family oxidoreductase [candidate division KSB1 bacterium]